MWGGVGAGLFEEWPKTSIILLSGPQKQEHPRAKKIRNKIEKIYFKTLVLFGCESLLIVSVKETIAGAFYGTRHKCILARRWYFVSSEK